MLHSLNVSATVLGMSNEYGVSWARVSDQIQTSLEDQHTGNRSRAAAMGVPIPADGEFQDIASRSDRSRWTGFDALLKRIQDPDCKYVFAWQDSRLIGDEMQFLILVQTFREAGVRLIYQNGTEQDLEDRTAHLMGLFGAYNNATEVIRTRQRVHDTHKIKAEAGRLISRPPYGIDVIRLEDAPCGGVCMGNAAACEARHGEVSKKGTVWVVNQGEVEALELMYRHIADGRSWGELIRRLTLMGIGTKQRTISRSATRNGEVAGGQPWVKTSAKRVLENEFYKGTFTWNKTVIKRIGPVKKTVAVPREEWVTSLHALGPLVDPDLWERANEQMRRRSKTREEQRVYPLMLWDNFLTCGRCGWTMSPYRRNNGTKSFGKLGGSEFDYRCNGVNNAYCKCTENHSIAERALDYYLGRDITLHHLMPTMTVSFQDAANHARDIDTEKRELNKRLIELDEQRDRVDDMEIEGKLKPERADSHRARITEEKTAAEARLKELEASPEGETISGEVPAQLRALWPLLRNEELPIEERRLALGRLIDKVVVDKPSIRVILRSDAPE